MATGKITKVIAADVPSRGEGESRILLATVGRHGRKTFNRIIIEKLQAAEVVTAAVKVAWNYQIAQITAA